MIVVVRIKMTTKLAGTVKWFSNSKGYGFIVATAAADDETISVEDEIFVHHTKIIAPPDAYKTLVRIGCIGCIMSAIRNTHLA